MLQNSRENATSVHARSVLSLPTALEIRRLHAPLMGGEVGPHTQIRTCFPVPRHDPASTSSKGRINNEREDRGRRRSKTCVEGKAKEDVLRWEDWEILGRPWEGHGRPWEDPSEIVRNWGRKTRRKCQDLSPPHVARRTSSQHQTDECGHAR